MNEQIAKFAVQVLLIFTIGFLIGVAIMVGMGGI